MAKAIRPATPAIRPPICILFPALPEGTVAALLVEEAAEEVWLEVEPRDEDAAAADDDTDEAIEVDA
jgi:hypothetical protein